MSQSISAQVNPMIFADSNCNKAATDIETSHMLSVISSQDSYFEFTSTSGEMLNKQELRDKYNLEIKRCSPEYKDFVLINLSESMNRGFHCLGNLLKASSKIVNQRDKRVEGRFNENIKKLFGNFVTSARRPFTIQCVDSLLPFWERLGDSYEHSIAQSKLCRSEAWINDPIAPGMKIIAIRISSFSKLEQQATFFHEIFHLVGYGHAEEFDDFLSRYDSVYGMENCCFSEDGYPNLDFVQKHPKCLQFISREHGQVN